MEKKVNPNGVNPENTEVKKAAPPPMKRTKKGGSTAPVSAPAQKQEKKNSDVKEEPKKTAPEVLAKGKKEEVKKEEVKKEISKEAEQEPKQEVKKEEKKEDKSKQATSVAVPVAEPQKAENKEVKNEESKKIPTPVKASSKNKNLKLIIPVVAVLVIAIIGAIALVSGKEEPVTLTDANGVPVTDENGNAIMVVPETEIVKVTDAFGNVVLDADGEERTHVVYKDVVVKVPVTDKNGNAVTDANGNQVTETRVVTPVPTVGNSSDEINTTESLLGTTGVPLTDGKGNTGVDEQGNVLTTIINITEPPTLNIDPAKTEWKNTQGGSAADRYKDVILTSDGAYITVNVSNSNDGDFAEFKELNLSSPYTVMTKYSKDGEILWRKPFGSQNGSLELVALSPCSDGSFYAVGYGRAVEDLSIKGYYDGAVYKINKNGEVEWVKSFGSSSVDIFNDVITASNGDAVIVGSIGMADGDASDSGAAEGNSMAIIMRYSSSGSLLWKTYAGGNMDTYVGIAETNDGSLFALGNFYSGRMIDALGKCDSGVIKYSSAGKFVKKTAIAGTGIDEFKGITATKDGGIVVCGSSDSSDTEESAKESFFKNDLSSRGGYDSYIIKYTNDLVVKFATPIRGQNNDTATSVMELPDGTYVVAGATNSSTRDFKGVTTRGKKDIFVAGFSDGGTLCWVRSFGGTENDGALAICNGADGGYVVVGESYSKNVDLDKIAPYGGNGKSIAVMIKFPE